MRKVTLILAASVLALAVTAPALAWFRVISDDFNKMTGVGVAVIQVESNLYAEVRYRDMDGSQSYSPRDQRVFVRYFRREAL